MKLSDGIARGQREQVGMPKGPRGEKRSADVIDAAVSAADRRSEKIKILMTAAALVGVVAATLAWAGLLLRGVLWLMGK